MNAYRNRIKGILQAVNELRYVYRYPVTDVMTGDGDYQFSERFNKADHEWEPFGRDETWGGKDLHYWFFAEVTVTEAMAGLPVRAILNTGADDIWNTDNPQVMAYVDGKLAGTMDMNHQDVILAEAGVAGTVYELAFYAYSSTPNKSNFFHLDVAAYREDAARLYYDMKVLFEAVEQLPEDSLDRIDGLKVLNACANLLDLRKPGSEECFSSVSEAADYLEKEYYEKLGDSPITVHCVGHTHIDVAWKWPVKQTRQKAVRSFNTVLNLMKRYPEYKFMLSQPQLYEFVKEEAPEVFEQVKERIKEGRWEAEGAMWLEPDCNLASGESLIRHIIYGRRFFEEELGAPANEVLWLPDVFGYSAAIPQIMKKSGLSYFMTTKLGWNEFNQFPHDTFMWKGIDGSEVLTYMISTRNYVPGNKAGFATTYNGLQNPSQTMGTWQRYLDKDVSNEVLTCYGYGDGGGGPTEEMLEQTRRLEHGVAQCPNLRQSHVKDFFHLLEETMDKSRLATWSGELYLEHHRGTYTSVAKNKKNNRVCEFLNGAAEIYSVMAGLLDESFAYPKEKLEKNWKALLLNQFHDILPGSSIGEVYDETDREYAEVIASDWELIEEAKKVIMASLTAVESAEGAEAESLAVFNHLSFPRTSVVEMKQDEKLEGGVSQTTADGTTLYLVQDAAPLGMTKAADVADRPADVFQSVETGENGRPAAIKTAFYEISFDANGEISSLVDLREQRELIKEGETGNRLTVYEDRPMEFDAWNIDAFYREKSWQLSDLESFEVTENGPVRGTITLKRRFLDSTVEQTICFYNHTARIDFKTNVDWHEHQLLLRTAFPLDILCNEADYEIQFGNVKRPTHENTDWDRARFEVCAHKWVDMSEPGYGTALLNDCKYGYDIHDSVMGLTLIKSGIFPYPEADQGHHEFTYSLFPHQGDFREGGVIREAYDLNCPLEGAAVGKAAEDYSILSIDQENILADTVKMAEDGSGIIVRFYEAYGKRTNTRVHLPKLSGVTVMDCDCMENELGAVCQAAEGEGTVMEFQMKPYEIKTIKIKKN